MNVLGMKTGLWSILISNGVPSHVYEAYIGLPSMGDGSL